MPNGEVGEKAGWGVPAETRHRPSTQSPLIMTFVTLLPSRLIMRKSLIQHLQQRGVQVSEWLFIAWACWLCF